MSSPIASFSATDFDRDGVPDDEDSCPKLQEDYQGTIDGCPSTFVPWYDEDFDGIEDHIDNCPDLRENYNKYQDEDGCPDISPAEAERGMPDSDGDGFTDNADNCPTIPETFNGILDTDGCPDDYIPLRDTDRDGI
ncbi:MAG: thrombospondin type 3 repeat-containing protein, partial [Nitrosopumilaceae archaeon]